MAQIISCSLICQAQQDLIKDNEFDTWKGTVKGVENSNMQWDEIPSTAHLLDKLTSSCSQELSPGERVHQE